MSRSYAWVKEHLWAVKYDVIGVTRIPSIQANLLKLLDKKFPCIQHMYTIPDLKPSRELETLSDTAFSV